MSCYYMKGRLADFPAAHFCLQPVHGTKGWEGLTTPSSIRNELCGHTGGPPFSLLRRCSAVAANSRNNCNHLFLSEISVVQTMECCVVYWTCTLWVCPRRHAVIMECLIPKWRLSKSSKELNIGINPPWKYPIRSEPQGSFWSWPSPEAVFLASPADLTFRTCFSFLDFAVTSGPNHDPCRNECGGGKERCSSNDKRIGGPDGYMQGGGGCPITMVSLSVISPCHFPTVSATHRHVSGGGVSSNSLVLFLYTV